VDDDQAIQVMALSRDQKVYYWHESRPLMGVTVMVEEDSTEGVWAGFDDLGRQSFKRVIL
jgi:hypothetical protein